MTLEEIYQGYALNDGQIISFEMTYSVDRTVTVVLQVRKHLPKQQYQPSRIIFVFQQVTELDVLEDFGTEGNYSDVILTRLDDNQFYLSLDPFDNTGEPSGNDNFVIKAKLLLFMNEMGAKYTLS